MLLSPSNQSISLIQSQDFVNINHIILKISVSILIMQLRLVSGAWGSTMKNQNSAVKKKKRIVTGSMQTNI